MSRKQWQKKQAEFLASLPFSTPYNRPTTFDDPGYDWSDEDIERVLNAPDWELGWWEFRAIFQVGLPLASYQQGVYFIPHAIQYLKARRDNHLEFIGDLVWFASEHKSNLDSDHLTDKVEAAFLGCLTQWTSKFEVIHFDKAACEAKGWGLQYDDHVNGSWDMLTLLDELERLESFSDCAMRFVQSLETYSADPIRSAWFLEYCKKYRENSKYGLHRHAPPPPLQNIVLLQQHAEIVIAERVAWDESPTYWNDVFAWLGLYAIRRITPA